MKLKLGHKGLILVMVPLMFQILLLSGLIKLQSQTEHELELEAKGRNIVEHLNGLFAAIIHTVGDLTGYTVTSDPNMLRHFNESESRARQHLDWLEANLDEKGMSILIDVRQTLNQGFAQMNDIRENVGRGERAFALRKMLSMKPALARLEDRLKEVIADAQAVYQKHSQASIEARNATKLWLLSGVLVDVLLAVALVYFFTRSTTHRLSVLMENTQHLAANEPLVGRISGTDEISELDAVFHDMAAALKAADERKSEILHMVAHDLRSPLSSALISLEMLNKGAYGELPTKAASVTDSILNNVDRLVKLINDFLDVERLQRGGMSLTKKDHSLARIIEVAIDSLEQLARAKQISIDYPDEPGHVYADSDRLIQVLINLLSNAIKFSPETSTISIGVERLDGSIVVSVCDQGPGVPLDLQKTIFERFEQVRAEDQKKGSGLGLAICKSIIESHGGSIGVESGQAVGSRFWFSLPVQT